METPEHEDLERLMEALRSALPDEWDRAVEGLARAGRRAVPLLLNEMSESRQRIVLVIKILERMGYPENAAALDFCIQEARWPYTSPPLWDMFLNLLVSIGAPTIPGIRNVIANHAEEDEWINAVTNVLSRIAPSSDLLSEFLPELVGALTAGIEITPSSYLNRMDIVARIGSPRADVAIPVIARYYVNARWDKKPEPGEFRDKPGFLRVYREVQDDVRRAAISALSQFAPTSLTGVADALVLAKTDPIAEIETEASRIRERMSSNTDDGR